MNKPKSKKVASKPKKNLLKNTSKKVKIKNKSKSKKNLIKKSSKNSKIKIKSKIKRNVKSNIKVKPKKSLLKCRQSKIKKVMHEFKTKKLKLRNGRIVTNRKQGIAIALSEANRYCTSTVSNVKQ